MRTTVAAALCLTLVVTGSGYGIARADTLSSLKDKYEQLQKQQQDLQKQLNALSSQVSAQQKKKDALDKNVSLITQQVTVLNSQIGDADKELAKTNENIEKTQKRIEENTALYKDRVRSIYEAGSYSKLELLLSAKSVTDLFARIEVLKTISEHDNAVIDELKNDKQKLKDDQASLKKKLEDLQSLHGTLDSKKQVLSAQQQDLSEVVNDLNNKVSDTQDQKNDVKQEARETDAQINKEIARLAEIRRKELAAKNGGKSGGKAAVSSSYIVNYASGLIGIRYRYGSADPRYGFDCSGLVQYVYAKAAGIYLPHSAAAQAGYGHRVSRSALQPGDLVFFATGGGSINHVGIYAGGGTFIGANTGSVMAVTRADMSSGYWAQRYVCAVRLN